MDKAADKASDKRKKTINWHFLWISVIVSVTVSVPVSIFIFDEIRWDLIAIGGIVPLFVAPAMIYMSYRSRRRVENELERYRERLEDLVQERTEDLAVSEKRYRAMFESSPIGIVVSNRDGMLIEPNSKFLQMLGYSRDELKVNFPNITHGDDLEGNIALYKEMLAGKRDGFSLEKRYIKKDGSIMWGNLNVTSIRDKKGKYLYNLAMIEDISERVTYEKEMQKARNLRSLGVLAGGIAHDYNNILTVMLNNIAVAKAGIPEGMPSHKKLVEVENKFWQAKNLSRQLMTFAGGDAPARKSASVSDLLMDTVKFSLSGSGVAVNFNIAPDLSNASIDTGQISQVIGNITLNAKDSMKGEGILGVGASNRKVDRDSGIPLEDGEYIFVTIKDSGSGIDSDVLPSIFDPYFTTKEQGTGLGLATSYSIIKKHGGHIAADNAPEGGAEFSFYLPATHEPEKTFEGAVGLTSDTKGISILLMDDDAEIRQSMKELLEVLGHEVTAVSDGAAAIDEYKRAQSQGTPYGMCILDLTVPGGLGGKEALDGIREADARAKVIVSSGYSDKVVVAEFKTYGFDAVLLKPYSTDELKDTIARTSRL